MTKHILSPGTVPLATLRMIWSTPGPDIDLEPQAWAAIDASRTTVEDILKSGRTVYGVNTGFGLLAQTRIENDKLMELQRNLILSHCCGVGDFLPGRVVRLALALKIIGLGRGMSGVRTEVVKMLLSLLCADALPAIPAQGSVGASGDLAPLAHLAASLLGIGHIVYNGETRPAQDILGKLKLHPLEPGPKEGLALLNGTQISTALALDALFQAEDVFKAALVTGALSTDALKGSDAPFDPRIHSARGHKGQIYVAKTIATLLENSPIRQSHEKCDKVQDPYSLRCQPQVMGACLDVMIMVAHTLQIEANAVTDNPLVFPEDGTALSGGNFHAEPVAFAADMLTNSLCEIASLSERRLAILVDPKMSGLPPFLVENSGLNSGFMIAQVTAAALVAENKMLAHPASVDSIPTSANQEDHVSMATHGARRAGQVAGNAAHVIGIELLTATQGLDFLRPLSSSLRLEAVHQCVRDHIQPYHQDRYQADDMTMATRLVQDGVISDVAGLPPLPFSSLAQ